MATICVNVAERDDLPPVIYPSTLLHDAILTHTFCGRAGIAILGIDDVIDPRSVLIKAPSSLPARRAYKGLPKRRSIFPI